MGARPQFHIFEVTCLFKYLAIFSANLVNKLNLKRRGLNHDLGSTANLEREVSRKSPHYTLKSMSFDPKHHCVNHGNCPCYNSYDRRRLKHRHTYAARAR